MFDVNNCQAALDYPLYSSHGRCLSDYLLVYNHATIETANTKLDAHLYCSYINLSYIMILQTRCFSWWYRPQRIQCRIQWQPTRQYPAHCFPPMTVFSIILHGTSQMWHSPWRAYFMHHCLSHLQALFHENRVQGLSQLWWVSYVSDMQSIVIILPLIYFFPWLWWSKIQELNITLLCRNTVKHSYGYVGRGNIHREPIYVPFRWNVWWNFRSLLGWPYEAVHLQWTGHLGFRVLPRTP